MMYAAVRLLSGFSKELTYKVPDAWGHELDGLPGTIVHVPLKNKVVPAIVQHIGQTRPAGSFAIREIKARERFPADPFYEQFITALAQYYFLDPLYFYQRIKQFLRPTRQAIVIHDGPMANERAHVTLTSEQQNIVHSLVDALDNEAYTPALLHGVTGSGKTEIYKKLIEHNYTAGKTTILLHPEVTLSLQFSWLLHASLPAELPIFSFHSATKEKEKKVLWQHLIAGKPCLILGVHLPILLPISRLGLIIVDEEHETGFIEKKHPKLNSKEIAIWRASRTGIPILLGSATPSLTSLAAVKEKSWKFFQLTKRFAGTFPTVTHVRLDAKTKRANFWVSKELQDAIALRLAKKEQVIIYLNRRGLSFFVTCKQCTYTFACEHCSVSLTPHEAEGGRVLSCHYCGREQQFPANCPSCGADEKHFLSKGIGTQQAVRILAQLFPQARIARADLDTTKKKREWAEVVKNFTGGGIDIIVGTQTITKGYHFPNVTLVGVLWADLNLHFPLYNATESTLQQLVQVAGRAGRGVLPGEVIVQSLSSHEVFGYLDEQKYLQFYQKEMTFRQEASYPPYTKFVQLEIRHKDGDVLVQDVAAIFAQLNEHNKTGDLGVTLLGPVKPIVFKVQNVECRHIFLKSKHFANIHKLLSALSTLKIQSSIHVVPST